MQATRDAFGKTLVELGAEHEDIVVLTADLGESTRASKFGERFPDRYFNMGVAEANMTNTAAGLAASGKTPYITTFAMFATGRAWEMVRNTVAYAGLRVRICASHAGLSVGEDGASHQTCEDLALMRVIPGMTIVVPADPASAAAATRAIYDVDGPVYLRLGRPKVPDVYVEGGVEWELGKLGVLGEGDDVALFAIGHLVEKAVRARELLAADSISAAVLDCHTLKPLDVGAVTHWARRTGCAVTAEEHSVIGGLHGAIAETLAREAPIPIEPVAVMDTFGESGTPDALFEKYGMTAENIAATAKRAIARK